MKLLALIFLPWRPLPPLPGLPPPGTFSTELLPRSPPPLGMTPLTGSPISPSSLASLVLFLLLFFLSLFSSLPPPSLLSSSRMGGGGGDCIIICLGLCLPLIPDADDLKLLMVLP